MPACCLVSFHFLWAILSTSTVKSSVNVTFAYCDTFIWSGPNSVTISGKHCINISASVENANPLSGKNSSASLFKGEGESAINSKRTAEEREGGREGGRLTLQRKLCCLIFFSSSDPSLFSEKRRLKANARPSAHPSSMYLDPSSIWFLARKCWLFQSSCS